MEEIQVAIDTAEIASFGGDVSRYAPPEVCEALRRKFADQ